MFYRARVDLAFPNEKEANKAIEKAVDVLPFAVVINPATEHEERGYIVVEQCYHDEDPSKPCDKLLEHLVPYP